MSAFAKPIQTGGSAALKSRIGWSVLAASALMVAAGVSGRAGAAEICLELSEGNNLIVSSGCYALEVPADVDLLRLRAPSTDFTGSARRSLKLSLSADDSEPGLCTFGVDSDRQWCAIPGPDAGRMYVHIRTSNSSQFHLGVHFEDATPVTGAAVDRLTDFGDARMFRFDGMQNAAVILLASFAEDAHLSVRRGTPPTLWSADCTSSMQHLPHHAGTAGQCSLGAGAGPVYAFVTLWGRIFLPRVPATQEDLSRHLSEFICGGSGGSCGFAITGAGA